MTGGVTAQISGIGGGDVKASTTAGGTAISGTTTGGTNMGGTTTGGVAASSTATGGTAKGGTAPGGAATGGAATGGAATGGASSLPLREEIKWLTFQGTRADAADPPNGSLGIDGQLRVDSDECVEATYSSATRCVSGYLCSYSYSNQYWGVALVLDFVNTAGQRFRWDPRPYNAVGVAYRLSGAKIPRLQLWVLDMDTTAWPNACTGSPCEIVGPPYGDDNIAASGTLYFDSMMHDNWDGTGIDYRHRPENTLSLQFKIPAVMVGSVAFEFCLDQLGIVVQVP